MFSRVILILAVAAAATSGPYCGAAPAQKQPWEWTDEERIAARVDPNKIRERIAAADARNIKRAASNKGTVSVDAVQRADRGDQLDGGTHPELFLPIELLDAFLKIAYAFGNDEVALSTREAAAREAVKAGLPADFLRVFEVETAAIVPLHVEEMQLRDRLANGGTRAAPGAWERIVLLADQQCPLHAAAVTRLRATYGVAFDRFLYQYVASKLSRAFSGVPPRRDELQRKAGGCR